MTTVEQTLAAKRLSLGVLGSFFACTAVSSPDLVGFPGFNSNALDCFLKPCVLSFTGLEAAFLSCVNLGFPPPFAAEGSRFLFLDPPTSPTAAMIDRRRELLRLGLTYGKTSWGFLDGVLNGRFRDPQMGRADPSIQQTGPKTHIQGNDYNILLLFMIPILLSKFCF